MHTAVFDSLWCQHGLRFPLRRRGEAAASGVGTDPRPAVTITTPAAAATTATTAAATTTAATVTTAVTVAITITAPLAALAPLLAWGRRRLDRLARARQNIALIDPHLNTDVAILSQCLIETVVDVGAERLERDFAGAILLPAGHL
jgi:hypothetical protein